MPVDENNIIPPTIGSVLIMGQDSEGNKVPILIDSTGKMTIAGDITVEGDVLIDETSLAKDTTINNLIGGIALTPTSNSLRDIIGEKLDTPLSLFSVLGRIRTGVGYLSTIAGAITSEKMGTDLYSYFFDGNGDPLALPTEPNTLPHTFHDEAIATADGTVFECDGQYKKLRLGIVRANVATNQIDFLQSIGGVVYSPLLGVKITADTSTPAQPVITTAINSTGTTSVTYEFDIGGIKYIMMDLSTLTGAGATLTIKGVAVA